MQREERKESYRRAPEVPHGLGGGVGEGEKSMWWSYATIAGTYELAELTAVAYLLTVPSNVTQPLL